MVLINVENTKQNKKKKKKKKKKHVFLVKKLFHFQRT